MLLSLQWLIAQKYVDVICRFYHFPSNGVTSVTLTYYLNVQHLKYYYLRTVKDSAKMCGSLL